MGHEKNPPGPGQRGFGGFGGEIGTEGRGVAPADNGAVGLTLLLAGEGGKGRAGGEAPEDEAGSRPEKGADEQAGDIDPKRNAPATMVP